METYIDKTNLVQIRTYLDWLNKKLEKENVPLRKVAILEEIRRYKKILEGKQDANRIR